MSIMNLMLLGFFMEKPMNAYEVKKQVDYRNLTWWIKSSSPSIYRNINTLAAKGYIDGEIVRDGQLPEKTIYTINECGKAHFYELMKQFSSAPPPIFLDFTAIISNINKVDKETGQQLIRELYLSFASARDILLPLENQYSPYHAKAVIQLSQNMYDTICKWLQQFYVEYFHTPFNM